MANIAVTRKDSIVDQLGQLHQRIASRAYDLFRSRDGWGDALRDWLNAEQELIWKPAVELREQDGCFAVAAALPGVDVKDITVDITPQELVIKAVTEHTHRRQGPRPSLRVRRGARLPIALVSEGCRHDKGQGRSSERNASHHGSDCPHELRARRVDVTAA
jgi:HSP20 family molecular chaperone IbpA